MMKSIFASLLVMVGVAAYSPAFAQDTWTGSDKKLHFGVSFVLGYATGNQWPDNKPLAIGVAMIPGILKEVADSQKGGSGFSSKDLVWDLVGATLGVYSAHWMIRRNDGSTQVVYKTEF